MRRLRTLATHNFGLKLLAIGISFSLWAIYTAEPFAQIGYNVPVAYVNVPSGMVISGVSAVDSPVTLPVTVRVVMRGRTGLLRRLTPADLNLTVNLAGSHAGQIPVQLTSDMVRVPYGTEVLRIVPAEFRVMLVPTSTRVPAPE